MGILRDIVDFRCDRFAPMLPEQCQVNPGVYGAELASWLCFELARNGIVTSYPRSEDWGWCIGYSTDSGSEFAVHCGNVDGAKDRWLLSLHPHARKVFGRDKPPYSEAEPLVSAIRIAVQSVAQPADIHWLYGEQDIP